MKVIAKVIKHSLSIELKENFGLLISQKIDLKLKEYPQIKHLKINLSQTKFVDSEAIRFLYSLLKKGIDIELTQPPDILQEVLEVLELKEIFIPLVK